MMFEKIKKWDTRVTSRTPDGKICKFEIFFETESGKYYGVALHYQAIKLERAFNNLEEITIDHEPVCVEKENKDSLFFNEFIFGYRKTRILGVV